MLWQQHVPCNATHCCDADTVLLRRTVWAIQQTLQWLDEQLPALLKQHEYSLIPSLEHVGQNLYRNVLICLQRGSGKTKQIGARKSQFSYSCSTYPARINRQNGLDTTGGLQLQKSNG